MSCEHPIGGLQLSVYRQGQWYRRCLLCGREESADAPGWLPEAGSAACTGLIRHEQRRFIEASRAFAEAAVLSGDARFHFAALLSRWGVTYCGNEAQPTFGMFPMPAGSLRESAEWQAVEQAVSTIAPDDYQAMCALLGQLEEILGHVRTQEGRSACDVFLCYRRAPGNIQAALQLCSDLTAGGLRVFCADVTTRGKTQEQFESEVFHALNTAEYLVLFPGEDEDALTPWMHNELIRAAAPQEHRMLCLPAHRSVPDAVSGMGDCITADELSRRLLGQAAECTADRLYARALEALRSGTAPRAIALLQRASAKGSAAARLLTAGLYREGLILPQDPSLAAHYDSLCSTSTDSDRQRVNDDFLALEDALHIVHRQALIYLVADVSDAGVTAAQLMAKAFFAALNADRLLTGAEVCVVGYDRHARVLEEPKALAKYGLPGDAAKTLRTCRKDGCDGASYAAKGLRCAADHLQQQGTGGRIPALVLLRPCLTNDRDDSLQAALLMLEDVLPAQPAVLHSADQLDDCIRRLRALVQ